MTGGGTKGGNPERCQRCHAHNLDPDVGLRYRPIVDHIHPGAKVLEVGRGSVGLAQLISEPVISCDIESATDRVSSESFIKASGTQLPFRDRSFDTVVVVDVLEHLPRGQRSALVEEAIRVACKEVFLAFPTARSGRAERRHQALLVAINGVGSRWLDEHEINGLPGEDEILQKVPPSWLVDRYPNVNMLAWHVNRVLVDVFNIRLTAFVALGSLLDFGPTYRTVLALRRGL